MSDTEAEQFRFEQAVRRARTMTAEERAAWLTNGLEAAALADGYSLGVLFVMQEAAVQARAQAVSARLGVGIHVTVRRLTR